MEKGGKTCKYATWGDLDRKVFGLGKKGKAENMTASHMEKEKKKIGIYDKIKQDIRTE